MDIDDEYMGFQEDYLMGSTETRSTLWDKTDEDINSDEEQDTTKLIDKQTANMIHWLVHCCNVQLSLLIYSNKYELKTC